jgi:hypothetical protein
MFNNEVYKNALSKAKEELRKRKSPNGFEDVVQEHLTAFIGNPARREVPLLEIEATQAWGDEKGCLDILYGNYGIELKVVRVPRIGAVPSNALYDIGQLSSDYWRIQNAKQLKGGELCVLLYGCLVTELNKPSAILREFHNRMFLDYYTSLKYGELKTQSKSEQRIRQIGAIKEMGFDKPYCTYSCKAGKKSVVNDEFALIIIPVKFS